MKRKIITLFISIIAIMSCITLTSADNTTNELIMMENSPYAEEENRLGNIENSPKNESDRIGENVKTTNKGINDNGYLNISFDDGYNGYCINYGQAGADVGDNFKVKNTSAAINNKNYEQIGNYIKILFVDYYDYIINNPEGTQKIIWSFSDNYNNGNKTIINEIINIAKSGRVIADHGEEKTLNNTTKVIFDFEVLDSDKGWAQNFFGYKLTYKNITNGILGDMDDNNTNESIENETIKNETIPENNTTENSYETIYTIPVNNSTETNLTDINEKNQQEDIDIQKSTGNPLLILLILLGIIGFCPLKRD